MLPRVTTNDSYMRVFQYKMLNNVLYLNKKLHQFGKKNSPLCSFCNVAEETPEHAFCECSYTQNLWNQLTTFLQPSIAMPPLIPQSALVGYPEETNFLKSILYNHLLLIFKLFIYRNRESGSLRFIALKRQIISIFKTEIKTESLFRQNQKYSQKWSPISPLLENEN